MAKRLSDLSGADDLRGKLGLRAGREHRTLADRAFATIHEGIVSGALEAGQRLPIEDLAESLEMSPMPVREALRRLDAVGLVEHIPHRGARVTMLSIEDLVDVYQARLALEPLAVRQTALQLTEETAERATEALRVLSGESRRSPNLWPAHTAFHFALYEGAHSRWLMRLIRPLWESSERYRTAIVSKGSKVSKAVLDLRQQDHEEILAAVLAQQADRAAAAMHNHLSHTANFLAREMGAEDVFPLVKVPKGRARSASAHARGNASGKVTRAAR